MSEKKTKDLKVRCGESLHERMVRLVKKEMINKAIFIRRAIFNEVKRSEKMHELSEENIKNG